MSLTYHPTHPDIVFQAFDDEFVVLDLRSGSYFGLNRLASAAWSALVSGSSPAQLVNAGMTAQRVQNFIDQLIQFELLVAQPGEGVAVQPELAQTLSSVDEDPLVERFDELSDLIQADPIHEVSEELGWPHAPVNG